MWFYCFLEFLMYFFVFLNFCFVLFFSMKIVTDHFFNHNLGQNQLIKVIKRKNNHVFMSYDKTLLSIGNVHKITKLSQFWVDMHSWKGAWLRNGYARLPQIWSQEMCETSKKKVMKRRSEIYSRCGLIAQKPSRGGGFPPPPQPFLGLSMHSWASIGGGGGGTRPPQNFQGGGHNIKCSPPPHYLGVVFYSFEMGTRFSCELYGTVWTVIFFFACQRGWWSTMGTPNSVSGKLTQKFWGRKKGVGIKVSQSHTPPPPPPPPPTHQLFPKLRDFRGWRRTDKILCSPPPPPPPPWSSSNWRPWLHCAQYAVKVRRHTPWSRVRYHGCRFTHRQFHSQFHLRRHSLRKTLKI